jgi:nicotinamidase-related amidase
MAGPALLVLDMINELVHPDGHYSHVCQDQVAGRGVIERTATAIDRARAARIPVIHVVLGYGSHYQDWPARSSLFGPPDPEHRFTLGGWGTRIHERLVPEPGEDIVTKQRISPFYATNLAGVATDLVVLATAREAHDRDFDVEVLEDATATGDEELQQSAVLLLARTAVVSSVDAGLPVAERVGR